MRGAFSHPYITEPTIAAPCRLAQDETSDAGKAAKEGQLASRRSEPVQRFRPDAVTEGGGPGQDHEPAQRLHHVDQAERASGLDLRVTQ